jgi:hypothetical protein
MKKVKVNTAKLQVAKEKIGSLTNLEMSALEGGLVSGASPCSPTGPTTQFSALNISSCGCVNSSYCPESDDDDC